MKSGVAFCKNIRAHRGSPAIDRYKNIIESVFICRYYPLALRVYRVECLGLAKLTYAIQVNGLTVLPSAIARLIVVTEQFAVDSRVTWSTLFKAAGSLFFSGLFFFQECSIDMDKKRIVFLSAKSGGGHDGAARSLIQLIQARFPDQYAFAIIDIYNGKIDKTLPFLAQIRHHSDVIWRLFLLLTNNRFTVALGRFFMARYMMGRIKKQLPNDGPIDLLVAVHFNPAQIVKDIAVTLPGAPRAVILATDYDPHWSWIGIADAIVVASDAGAKKALQVGYAPQQVLQLNVLPNEQALRQRGSAAVAADDGLFRLLMVSGQDGTNSAKILSLIERIDGTSIANKVTLDIYCGRNEALRVAVEKRAATLNNLQVRAHGFVVGLHERIALAHLIIMRASPQVLSECISSCVPVMAFDWSVHEQYQATLINRENIGFATKDQELLLERLLEAVNTPARYAHYRQNVNALAETFDANALLDHLFHAGGESVAPQNESTGRMLPG